MHLKLIMTNELILQEFIHVRLNFCTWMACRRYKFLQLPPGAVMGSARIRIFRPLIETKPENFWMTFLWRGGNPPPLQINNKQEKITICF